MNLQFYDQIHLDQNLFFGSSHFSHFHEPFQINSIKYRKSQLLSMSQIAFHTNETVLK